MSAKEGTGKPKLDDSKLPQLKATLEADEKREEAERAQNAKLFDIRALAADARKIHGVNVEGMGIVRYGLLTSAEFDALKLEKKDAGKRIYLIVCAMLKKADLSLPQKDIDELPYDAKTHLINTLLHRMPSFLPVASAKPTTGSTRTQKPKK